MQPLTVFLALIMTQAQPSYPGDKPRSVVVTAGSACTPAPTTLALYGDSIGAGAGNSTIPAAILANELGAGWFTSLNAGDGVQPAVSGYTAAQIRARYEATHATACLGGPCGYVVVQGGVNSLKGGVSPADTLVDMAAIVDHAQAQGYRVTWLDVLPYASCTSPTCTPESVADGHAKATEYNTLHVAACAARPGVRCLASYSDFMEPGQPGHLLAAYSAADGIHLLQAGADELYGRVAVQVQALQATCP